MIVVSRLICIFGFLAAAIAQGGQVMPRIEGESFSGHKVALPDAARGKVAVLVFGFTKASGGPTGAWADKIYSDFGARAGFELYQLPVLEDVPRLFRGMVISGIKKGVQENRREHFVPILQNEAELKKLVNYKEGGDAYLVMLNPVGQVVGQRHGPFSGAAYADLWGAIQTLLDHQK